MDTEERINYLFERGWEISQGNILISPYYDCSEIPEDEGKIISFLTFFEGYGLRMNV